MLVLFETAVGYAIFNVLDDSKLSHLDLCNSNSFYDILKLHHFEKFSSADEALNATKAHIEGKLHSSLRKMIKVLNIPELQETLAVADSKLGGAIKDKFGIQCIHDSRIQSLMRRIRQQSDEIFSDIKKTELKKLTLSLAHGLSRFKLKFSPDKVDTMVIQAISLLDDLDKELNNFVMRCKEWYGWHFPELVRIVTDNITYVKTILFIGIKNSLSNLQPVSILNEFLDEFTIKEIIDSAKHSFGTEITCEDILNIQNLCRQVIDLNEYRNQLTQYLINRMNVIAPNLTTMVGEMVGARLLSHAGSLINLAKHPSSTVQILGAEKALFRALKAKKNTPKYGLIYHASLVGQCGLKYRGKISRTLAAKTSIAARVDALGDATDNKIGILNRSKVEAKLKQFENPYSLKSEQSLKNVKRLGLAGSNEKFENMESGSDFIFCKNESLFLSNYSIEQDANSKNRKRKLEKIRGNNQIKFDTSAKYKKHRN